MDMERSQLGGNDAREAGKRDLILAAAQHIFSKKGFHQATVEEVAEAAGVGKGTVYLYFPSKKEILVALIEERLRDLAQALDARVRAVGDGLGACAERLRAVILLQLEFFKRSRDFLTVMSGDIGELGQELDERTREARRAFLKVVESVIREGIRDGEFRGTDSWLATYAIEGMVMGAALGWTMREGLLLTDEHVSQVVDLCLHGIAGEGGGPHTCTSP